MCVQLSRHWHGRSHGTLITHTCTSRASLGNFRACPCVTHDRGLGRDRPPCAWRFHAMLRLRGVQTVEFRGQGTMSRRSSRATSRTIGGRATRATAAPHGDWLHCAGGRFELARRHWPSRLHFVHERGNFLDVTQIEICDGTRIKLSDWSCYLVI